MSPVMTSNGMSAVLLKSEGAGMSTMSMSMGIRQIIFREPILSEIQPPRAFDMTRNAMSISMSPDA